MTGPFFPIDDLHLAAYLQTQGADLELEVVCGRVIFKAKHDEETDRLLLEFSQNKPVKILDYIKTEKKLRGRMLYMRDGGR